MKYLGIDFGGKNVGIAITDDSGKIAFPKMVLKNQGGLVLAIKNICKEENIEMIVLGRSINEQGESNEIQEQIERFKEALAFEVKLPIRWQYENFSSMHVMDEAKNKDGNDHAQAAALILQRYLERINN